MGQKSQDKRYNAFRASGTRDASGHFPQFQFSTRQAGGRLQ